MKVDSLNLLESIVVSDREKLKATVEYRDGIMLELCYVPKEELQRIGKEATALKYNPGLRGRVETVDSDKFIELYCKRAVTGWKGLTPRSLSNLIPVDLSKVDKEDLDKEIPFNQTQLAFLLKKCYDLDQFIQTAVSDARWFKRDFEEETKNSEASQSGS